LVRKGKEAFLSGDLETVKELLADDLVVHTSGDGPFEREYRGRDAFGFIGQLAQLSGGTYQQEIHDVVARTPTSLRWLSCGRSATGGPLSTAARRSSTSRTGKPPRPGS
jgi:ketosteroid isomerase-like protein